MKLFNRYTSIFAVALKRLFAQRGLTVAILVGLVVSISLIMSIPLYADAVYYKLLKDELEGPAGTGSIRRPPFSYMFRYVGSTYGAQEWEAMQPVDTYLSGPAAGKLGLPHVRTVRHFKTDNVRLFPADNIVYSDITDPLEWVSFGFVTDFENNIDIVEGRFPDPTTSGDPTVPIEVLISAAMADEIGIQSGENFMTFRRARTDEGTRTIQVPVVVTGVWEPRDPTSEFWFYNPNTFETVLIIPEQTYVSRIAPTYANDVYLGLWYLIMDGTDVTASTVPQLIANTTEVEQETAALLSNTRLGVSPSDALDRYQLQSGQLTVLLYAFSVPIMGLLLAFIGLVVGLSVARQRNEVAVLRSRGATSMQVVGISFIESVLLAGIALAAAYYGAPFVAQIIGSTQTFLNFATDADLRLVFNANTWRIGGFAVAVTVVAQLLPTIGASRFTIVTYKQEQARTLRPPWWQRAYMDVFLLVPAAYGIYLLQQQGNIAGPGPLTGATLFDNPLLFLVPALGLFALTLVALRFLPYFMALLAWIVSRTRGVGILLATRHLSRNRGLYTAPMVLLVLTLSLSTFTTSLAQTLDNHLWDQIHYEVGANSRLVELGYFPDAGGGAPGGGGGDAALADPNAQQSWTFVPVSEHLRHENITKATRLAEFEAAIQLQGDWRPVQYRGLDRLDFPTVAFWRRDFASANLGSLMNSLALDSAGVLMHGPFMRRNTIRVGDTVRMRFIRYGMRGEADMTVLGEFDYFPGWYPEDGALIVGNLDYLFETMGGQFPYDVLVETLPNTDFETMQRDLYKFDINVLNYYSARQNIASEQAQPQRQGLFGVLSVGFVASAILTILGFLLYTLFSFRRRFIELGTLRAVGLSRRQMSLFLAWELAFLIGVGIGIGTLLGYFMSDSFIPYLQVGTSPEDVTPPYQVDIAWDAITRVYALFGLLFVSALMALVVSLLRMRIFQAIKLGETV